MITDKAEKLVKKRANEVLKNYIEPVYTSCKLPEEPQPRLITLRETLLGFFQKLRNYWQWQMLIIESNLHQRNQEKLKANYCDEGWHQQNKCSGSISNGKRKFKYEYIECPICGIKFFPTVKDKHNYMRSTRPMRKLIKGLMK